MKRDLVVAGKAIGGAGLTGVILYLVATAPTRVHVYWPYWILTAMILVGTVLYLLGHDRPAAEAQPAGEVDLDGISGLPVVDQAAAAAEVPAVTAGPVITDRWRHTSDGGQVPALMGLTHTVMFHPGYSGRQAQDAPPSVKIGMLVACEPIDPMASGSELRAKFAAFLATDAVMTLIGSLTHVDRGMSWKSLAGNGPRTLEAALTAGEDVLAGAPVASALLLPSVAGESLYGRNGQSTTLILYVEPRTAHGQIPPASGLASWYERFDLALAMPAAFAEFLTKDLGLGTSDDPPAQLGVWLQSYHPLTTVVDTQGLRTLPASYPSNWYSGWAFASLDGKSGTDTAGDFVSQLCEYTLHLDSFQQRLDEISAERSQAAVSTWERRDLPVLVAAMRLLDVATAQVRVSTIVEACGLKPDEVASAVETLDGTYLTLQRTLGDTDSWFVSRPTAAARRAVGQWPR